MPIVYRRIEGFEDVAGFYAPMAVCDECGKQIKDPREGNAQWVMGTQPVDMPVVITHKACNHPFEHKHPLSGDQMWGWAPLSKFAVDLARNMGYPKRGKAITIKIDPFDAMLDEM